MSAHPRPVLTIFLLKLRELDQNVWLQHIAALHERNDHRVGTAKMCQQHSGLEAACFAWSLEVFWAWGAFKVCAESSKLCLLFACEEEMGYKTIMGIVAPSKCVSRKPCFGFCQLLNQELHAVVTVIICVLLTNFLFVLYGLPSICRMFPGTVPSEHVSIHEVHLYWGLAVSGLFVRLEVRRAATMF